MALQRSMTHATQSTNLADLLERVLDKGVVIAGDIKIKLVDVELLTLQIRLVICSVEKAREIGIDWWAKNPVLNAGKESAKKDNRLSGMEARLKRLEASLASPES